MVRQSEKFMENVFAAGAIRMLFIWQEHYTAKIVALK